MKRDELGFIIPIFSNRSDFPDTVFNTIEIPIAKQGYYARKYHPLAKTKIDSRRLKEFPWIGNTVSPIWSQWIMKTTEASEEELENAFMVRLNDYDKAIELVKKTNGISAHVYNKLKPHEEAGEIKILDIEWKVPHPKNSSVIVSLKKRVLSPACEMAIQEIQTYSRRWEDE